MSLWSDTPDAREVGFRRMALELRRLRRRALARPLPVLLLAALATTGAVVRQALHKERFEASVAFRVVERLEGLPEGEAQPQTKRRLREYVSEGIFTRHRCGRLVKKYQLYPDWTSVSLDRAVDAFRDAISIKVSQNYFLRETWGDTTPRSARIRIAYSYTDVNVAAAVVEELGDLVQEHEKSVRNELAQQAANEAAMIDRRAGARLDQLRARMAEAHLALDVAPPRERATLQVEIGQLRQSIDALALQLDRLHSDRGLTELRAGLETHQLLMSFYKTDTSRTPPARFSRATRLVIVGLIVFLFFLPISGIAVAAFDPLIYSAEDVARLGLKPLGRLPGLANPARGSLCERLERSSDRSAAG